MLAHLHLLFRQWHCQSLRIQSTELLDNYWIIIEKDLNGNAQSDFKYYPGNCQRD
jgi:hypothetical protein